MQGSQSYTGQDLSGTGHRRRRTIQQVQIILTLVVAGLLGRPSDGAAQRTQSHTGHVIDLACYASEGATEYTECEQRLTVKEGQPMGLLTDDGTLVLFIYPSRTIYTRVQDLVGRQVRITGTALTRGRVRVFSVENVWTDMRPQRGNSSSPSPGRQ